MCEVCLGLLHIGWPFPSTTQGLWTNRKLWCASPESGETHLRCSCWPCCVPFTLRDREEGRQQVPQPLGPKQHGENKWSTCPLLTPRTDTGQRQSPTPRHVRTKRGAQADHVFSKPLRSEPAVLGTPPLATCKVPPPRSMASTPAQPQKCSRCVRHPGTDSAGPLPYGVQ